MVGRRNRSGSLVYITFDWACPLFCKPVGTKSCFQWHGFFLLWKNNWLAWLPAWKGKMMSNGWERWRHEELWHQVTGGQVDGVTGLLQLST